jgi:hypothetical protein
VARAFGFREFLPVLFSYGYGLLEICPLMHADDDDVIYFQYDSSTPSRFSALA